jgi:VWFA-related protein
MRLKRRKPIQFLIVFTCVLILLGFPVIALAATSYNLVIHHIHAVPREGAAAYDVKVYLSVLDEVGIPVKDLEIEDFKITEGSKTVEIESLDIVKDDPIRIVLLVDASGSMSGGNMTQAKEAAKEFIHDTERGDEIAVVSFDKLATTHIDFTDDRDDAENAVDKITALQNSDTCLYDAVYESVEMLATQPAGRRAVVVLTDGVDETISGNACSIRTIDDVLDLATSGSTRAPIYTIGLTDRSDERNLERLSTLTGGRYRYSPTRDELEETFEDLTDQLRSEYVLGYISTSSAGEHTILVEVDHRDTRDQDTRDFVLPELAVSIFISMPTEGAELGGTTTIEAITTGQENITEVVFRIDDTEVGSVNTSPYRLEYDFSLLQPGEYSITVIARDSDEEDIAQSSVSVTAVASEEDAVVVEEEDGVEPTEDMSIFDTLTPEAVDEGDDLLSNDLLLIGAGAFVLLVAAIVIIVIIISFLRRSKKKKEEYVVDPYQQVQYDDDKTMDGFGAPPVISGLGQPVAGQLHGTLRVRASEDPSMINQLINITKPRTTIGRGANNDIVLPRDKAVSRNHALIELVGSELFLTEFITQGPQGATRKPTYGTYVNGNRLANVPIQLKNGDEIRLGTQFIAQFEKIPSAQPGMDDKTMDGLGRRPGLPSDKTLDASAEPPKKDGDETIVL